MNSTAKQYVFLVALVAISATCAIGDKPNPKTTKVAFDPVESINRLAIDLYRETALREGNLFLSPYSISTALAMVYAGARGETAEQMNNTLHFSGPRVTHPAFSNLRKQLNAAHKGPIQLNIANSLWLQNDYTFLPNYVRLTQTSYKGVIGTVDFKNGPNRARQQINNWIETQTNHKIQDLLHEGAVSPQTRLVLANAIYFEGDWAKQFKKWATRKTDFAIQPSKTVRVPMMRLKDDFNLAWTDDFQALELPYDGDALSMIILLPTEIDGLPALENKLTPTFLRNLPFIKQEVEVGLPRFKFAQKLELNETLAGMGMPLAFSDQADFSGMNGTKKLNIGTVVHQAFIEVNEKGTKAAAATAVHMNLYCAVSTFIADHPFLFLIRENSTGTILFLGRVIDPTK